MVEFCDLIHWFQQKTTGEGPAEILRLQKLLAYSQAMHYAVYGTPLFTETIAAQLYAPVAPAATPVPEFVMQYENCRKASREKAIGASKEDASSAAANRPLPQLDESIELILKVVNFVYGTKTSKELEQLSPPEEPWRQSEDSPPRIANPEIDKEIIKACYAPLRDLFDAYRDFDFDCQETASINGNSFTYNSRHTVLTETDLANLREIGTCSRDQSYYLHKNRDGSLEITQL